MTDLERIARAICTAQGYDPNMVLAINETEPGQPFGAPVGDIARPMWKQPRFVKAARAAVEAMREPSERMIEAGVRPQDAFADIRWQWKDMIDTVLNEKT